MTNIICKNIVINVFINWEELKLAEQKNTKGYFCFYVKTCSHTFQTCGCVLQAQHTNEVFFAMAIPAPRVVGMFSKDLQSK